MNKSAVYIAGDENIYFPALVAIESIKEKNSGNFDYFMCFSGEKITPYMTKVLKEKGIFFIDSRNLESFNISNRFTSMTEGHWPIDIFYNYAMPLHLLSLGYDYSYKVDYDVLCINSYIIDEIEPKDVALSGWGNKVELTKENVPQSAATTLIDEGFITSTKVDYMNVGFIGFNNKIYSDRNMLGFFADAYARLQALCPEAKLLEQVAFALLIESTKGSFKKIPEKYNHRVLASRESNDGFEFETKNIHFITKFKPWKKIEKDKIKWFIFNGGSHMYLYRNLWLEYAAGVDGFEFFCMERPLTSMQMVGLQMHVVRCYNEKVRTLSK